MSASRTHPDAARNRFVVMTIILTMIVTGAILCISVVYFLRGSLEMFPTEEDHAKIRVVMGATTAILIAVELALWFLLRHLKRRGGASSRTM